MRVLSLSLRSRAWRRKIFVFCARAAFFAWAFHLLETESTLKETGCTNMRVCLSLCVQACIIYVYSAYVCVLFEHVHWFGGMWVCIWCPVFFIMCIVLVLQDGLDQSRPVQRLRGGSGIRHFIHCK